MTTGQDDLSRQATDRIGVLVDGKYRLLSVLGVGGMGSVYEAEHRFTDRRVAVKLLHPKLAKGTNAQRFLQEAKAAAHIDHPRVAQVLDAGQEGNGGLYLVMERLNGEDLGKLIREQRAPPKLMVQASMQVLEALEAAHAKDFVHRDIKPANVFLCRAPDGEADARLLDFGVARRLSPGAGRLTQAGAVVGTPYFMSPEQMCGEAVDGRADLWSLGVVLFYGLTGALPFKAEGYVELLKDMLRAGPPSPSALRPELDTRLCEVVTRALAPAIEDRYASAAQMRAALGAVPLGAREPPARVPSITAPLELEPAGPPSARAPARDRPPAWSTALDALESEIEALEAKKPEPEKRPGLFGRLRKKR